MTRPLRSRISLAVLVLALHLRLNPDSGAAVVDANLAFAAGDANDGRITS